MKIQRSFSRRAVALLLTTGLLSSVALADSGKSKPKVKSEDDLSFTDYPAAEGQTDVVLTGINRHLWVSGFASTAEGTRSFLDNGVTVTAANLVPADPLVTFDSFALGIANNGTAAGNAFASDGSFSAYTVAGTAVSQLVYPGSEPNTTSIYTVASDGTVLGEAGLSVAPFFVQFTYKNGVFKPVAKHRRAPFPNIVWERINASGSLLGGAELEDGSVAYVIADRGSYEVLPRLPANTFGNAVALLDSGEAVFAVSEIESTEEGDVVVAEYGLVSKGRKWLRVDHPEAGGFTSITAAVSICDNDFAVAGRRWDEASQAFVAFTAAPEKHCKRGRR